MHTCDMSDYPRCLHAYVAVENYEAYTETKSVFH